MQADTDLTKRRAMPVLSIPFTKVEMGDDGYVHFEGFGTAEVTDGDGEIVDLGSVKKAMPDYMQRANVREMHQLSAVGKVQEWNEKDNGIFLRGIVVDPDAITKCIERIYTGLSIGARTSGKQGNRVFVKRINEFSLVDDPACPKCTATFSKLTDPEEGGMSDVKKALYMVAQGAGILDQIAALRSDLQREMEVEGHVSPVAARLEEHVKAFGETLVMLTQEETAELTEPGAAAPALGAGEPPAVAPVADVAQVQAKADLEKASAAAKALAGEVHKQLLGMAKKLAETHKLDVSVKCDKCEAMKSACGKVHKEMGTLLDSCKSTLHPDLHGKLAAVHKAFGDAIGDGPADGKEPKKEVPADSQEKPEAEEKPETPADEAAEGEKINKLAGQVNDLTKAIAEKDAIIKARDERIKELEAEPVPPKGATKAIGKVEDNGGTAEADMDDKIKKAVESATPTNATEVIKLLHQTPHLVRLSGATKEAE